MAKAKQLREESNVLLGNYRPVQRIFHIFSLGDTSCLDKDDNHVGGKPLV